MERRAGWEENERRAVLSLVLGETRRIGRRTESCDRGRHLQETLNPKGITFCSPIESEVYISPPGSTYTRQRPYVPATYPSW